MTGDACTDDSAPGYDGLTAASVTAVSPLLVAATVGVIWVLDDTVVGRLAVLGALAVPATDWDLSGTASSGVLVLVLAGVLAVISVFVWDASTKGLPRWLYLRIWNVIPFVCAPVGFVLMYVHEVWRISERGLSPTVGAMATYAAVAGLLLIPIEYAHGVGKLVRKE